MTTRDCGKNISIFRSTFFGVSVIYWIIGFVDNQLKCSVFGG